MDSAPILSREPSFDILGSMATSHGGPTCPVPCPFPLAPAAPRQRATAIAGASRHLCLPAQLHTPLVGTGDTTAVGISEPPPRQVPSPPRAPVTRLPTGPNREGAGVSPKPSLSAKMRPAQGACAPHGPPNTVPVYAQWQLLQVLPPLACLLPDRSPSCPSV